MFCLCGKSSLRTKISIAGFVPQTCVFVVAEGLLNGKEKLKEIRVTYFIRIWLSF